MPERVMKKCICNKKNLSLDCDEASKNSKFNDIDKLFVL